MRSGGLVVAIVVLILIVMVIAFFTGGNSANVPVPELHSGTPDVVALAESVPYCPPALQTIVPGRVQVLLDSSGSMFGVRAGVVGVTRWIEQSISRMRGSAVIIDEMRLAQFDQTRGILPSVSFTALAAEYSPSGRTTLHEAIAASQKYDLTFIVTDGVAAAGIGGGECAAGVDAACVARALRNAVHVEQTTAVTPQPGVWLVPLWVRHSGVFFTEKAIATADFDGTVSLQKVHDELSQNVSISNARSDSEGNLVFDYTGPRGILLIVIARSDDLGRRAIAALRERMAENDVEAITTIRQATRPVSAFPPIELYPGYLPRLEWARFTESEDQPMSGTLDASFANGRIAIECASGRRNEGNFTLEAQRIRGAARCVEIYQLPVFEFAFIARNQSDQKAVASFISDSKHDASGSRERFDLKLQCGEGGERPCLSNPIGVTWIAQSRYDQSPSADASQTSGADALIDSIATTDLVTQPHRIYGLDSLVSIFFDEVRQDRRRIPLADLELCHGRVEGR